MQAILMSPGGYAEVAEVHGAGELVPAGLGIGTVALEDLLRTAAA